MDATAVPGSNTGATSPSVPANNATSGSTIMAKISKSTTGISLDNLYVNGKGLAHNNVQPSTALLYIQRIA